MTEQEIIDAIKANKFTVEYTAPDNVSEHFHIDGRRFFVIQYPEGYCDFGGCSVCVDGQEHFYLEFSEDNEWAGSKITDAISDALFDAVTTFGAEYDEYNYGDLAELKALELGVTCDEWYGPEDDAPIGESDSYEALKNDDYSIESDDADAFVVSALGEEDDYDFKRDKDGQWTCIYGLDSVPKELLPFLNSIYDTYEWD